jgi:hypothetical protein
MTNPIDNQTSARKTALLDEIERLAAVHNDACRLASAATIAVAGAKLTAALAAYGDLSNGRSA